MSEEKDRKDSDPFDQLKRMRDELALKMHLGTAEAKSEWAKLEVKWLKYEQQQDRVKDAVKDTGRNVGTAMDMAGDELKKGYERIRGFLKD